MNGLYQIISIWLAFSRVHASGSGIVCSPLLVGLNPPSVYLASLISVRLRLNIARCLQQTLVEVPMQSRHAFDEAWVIS